MMSQASFVQPPRVAIWCVNLFTPDEEAEAVQGDLLEEFSELALKSGVASARRWYWRQSVKSIVNIIGTGFRSAPPWGIASVLIGLFLLQSFVGEYLEQQSIWSPAYSLWIRNGLLIYGLLVSLTIGCIVATAAKGREMVVTITPGLILGGWSAVLFLVWSASHRHEFRLPVLMAFGASIMIVIGGGIVRERRSPAAHRATPAV
jgi:hypothetical protein